MQYRNFDAPARAQVVAIEWEKIERPDDSGDTPEDRDEGFWPSQDPESAGYVGEVTPEVFAEHMAKAQARHAAWGAGEWWFVGVIARAHISIPIGGGSFVSHTLDSAGCWGIESEEESEAYRLEVFEEEKAGLLSQLRTLARYLLADKPAGLDGKPPEPAEPAPPPPVAAPDGSPLYLVQDGHGGYFRAPEHGLCRDLDEAHRFTLDEAKATLARHAGGAPSIIPASTAPAFANLDGERALNLATAAGVAIYQDDGSTFYSLPGMRGKEEARGPFYGAHVAARSALCELEARKPVTALDGAPVRILNVAAYSAVSPDSDSLEVEHLDGRRETVARGRLTVTNP